MHFCFIGCGKISRTHAKILSKLENFLPGKPTRISFASRVEARALEYREEFEGDMAFGSYEAAMAHSDVDVVVICTPNDSHYELALKALEKNKHVVIEKPIALTTVEADEILKLASEKNRHVLIAENHRFRPSIRYLERLITSKQLGVIKFIHMNVMRQHHFKASEWRADPAKMGGGPLIDGGIHWVNALLTLGGGPLPQIVTAMEPPRTVENCPAEDSLQIMCQFESGAVGSLTYSWGISGAMPLKFIGVFGSRGSVYISNTGMFGWINKGIPRPVLLPLRDWKGYEAMWKDFLVCLANGSSNRSLASGAVGRRDLAFIETAYSQIGVRGQEDKVPKKLATN